MALRIVGSRAAIALAGVLLLGGGSGLSKPQKEPQKEPSAGGLVEALSALSPAQRSEYLQGQRSIEETRSSERLQQLTQVQSCLSRQSAPAAQKTCWQSYTTALQKSRAQQAQQQQELAKRFGLPEPAKKKKKQ
jgi:hypothetical protein